MSRLAASAGWPVSGYGGTGSPFLQLLGGRGECWCVTSAVETVKLVAVPYCWLKAMPTWTL